MSKAKEQSCSECYERHSRAKDQGNRKYSHHLSIEVAILEAKALLTSPSLSIIKDLSLLKGKPRGEVR